LEVGLVLELVDGDGLAELVATPVNVLGGKAGEVLSLPHPTSINPIVTMLSMSSIEK
jgi:hypothetical protein